MYSFCEKRNVYFCGVYFSEGIKVFDILTIVKKGPIMTWEVLKIKDREGKKKFDFVEKNKKVKRCVRSLWKGTYLGYKCINNDSERGWVTHDNINSLDVHFKNYKLYTNLWEGIRSVSCLNASYLAFFTSISTLEVKLYVYTYKCTNIKLNYV